ncbi:MAG: O-antigen ligase family protein [Burkholderiales bacterium]|nr:O-antigen ligase family protein [Burkholderiales bacterium]
MWPDKFRHLTIASLLVLAFPILLLSVPRGASVFLVATVVALIAVRHGLTETARANAAVFRPLSLSILTVLMICLASILHFDLGWNTLDNPSRIILAFLACLLVIHRGADSRLLWAGALIGLIAAAAVIAWQAAVLNVHRPSAGLPPIVFANMVAAIALIGFVRPGTDWRSHALAWVGMFLAALILIVNGSRGPWMALVITTLPLIPVRHRGMRLPAYLGIVLLLLLLIALAFTLPEVELTRRFQDIGGDIERFGAGDADSAVGARLMMWQLGLQTLIAHPLTGIGLNQYGELLMNLPQCPTAPFCTKHGHNDLMEALTTLGLPGIVLLFAMFAVPAILFRRMRRVARERGDTVGESLAVAGLAVVVATCISGLTQVTLAHHVNIVFYAGAIGLLLGLSAQQARDAGSV